MPKGLTMKEYPGSNNGRIIKWTNTYDIMIFEWNEDLKYGSHYHILTHAGNHILPGTPVPEPFNTLYFGR